jgi:LacI family sucrose operon transcriptional repressor
MPTIKDVARTANVAVGTVSRVMNNRGYLSEDIKLRVTAAIKELNYQPNDLARSLQKQKSCLLGLIVPSVAHPFFGEITQYIEAYAHDRGYKVLICNSLHDKDKEWEYITMLKRSKVDGIIMGSHVLDDGDYRGLHLPLISLDRQVDPDIPFICCDNYRGGSIATRHLIEKGCRNLIHISGSLSVPMFSNKRTDAFVDACKAAGIAFQCFELPDTSIVKFNEESLLQDILKKETDCDGIFTTSDINAAFIIGIAAKLGKRIPQDIKVLGFDDNIIASLLNPRLSTIHQPKDAISRYAVEYLIAMIEGKDVPTQTILPVQLVKRDST